MSKTNSSKIYIGAILLAGVAAVGIGTMLYNRPVQTVSAEQDAGTATAQAEVQTQTQEAQIPAEEAKAPVQEAKEQALHGQVIFDTTQSSLPAQSSLTIQLVASNAADNGQKVIKETVIPVSEASSPVDFTLPAVKFEDAQAYVLKAQISVGDTLLYANESALPVDLTHSAYRIHLAQTADAKNIQADKNQIIGQTWLAEDIMGGGIIDNSHMTLQIAAATPGSDENAGTSYKATGSGGCNKYNASLILDEQSKVIKFDNSIPTTMMSCPEALLTQEGKFIDMLTKASSYKFNEHGMLYLMDDNQNPIGRFTLAEND